uniref:Uncharacterized protein n=1 Tax=Chrysemys picta bellii TaxID=8478 RepID=A0A8C3PD49_CHRPI
MASSPSWGLWSSRVSLSCVHCAWHPIRSTRSVGRPLLDCSTSGPWTSPTICWGTMPRHSQLRVLDLSENSLNIVWNAGGCVDVFHHLDRLAALNLSRNNLQTLPEGLFQGLVSLQALDLSGNLMAMLPDGLFRDLHSLQVLGLQGNPLVTLGLSRTMGLSSLAEAGASGFSLWTG